MKTKTIRLLSLSAMMITCLVMAFSIQGCKTEAPAVEEDTAETEEAEEAVTEDAKE